MRMFSWLAFRPSGRRASSYSLVTTRFNSRSRPAMQHAAIVSMRWPASSWPAPPVYLYTQLSSASIADGVPFVNMRHTTPASVCPSRPFASERGAGGGGGPVGRFTRNSSTYRAGGLPEVQHHQPSPTCLERAVVAAQQGPSTRPIASWPPPVRRHQALLDGLLVADPRREDRA